MLLLDFSWLKLQHFPQPSKLSDSFTLSMLDKAHLFYSGSYCKQKWIRASADCINCKQLLEPETSVDVQTGSDDE